MKRNVHNKNPKTDWLTQSINGDWITKIKLTAADYNSIPPREPVFSAKLGFLPKLKRTGSPNSARTDLSLLSTSSLGIVGPLSERKSSKKRRSRSKQHLDWETFLRARNILLDEMLDGDGVDKDTDNFLQRRKFDPSSNELKTAPSSVSSEAHSEERADNVPPLITVDKTYLSPVIESESESQNSVADEISLPDLILARSVDPMHRLSSPAYRFISSVSPASMCFSSPCPSLKYNTNGVPDFERQVTLKVRQKIRMTTYELNRVTGYGDAGNLFIVDADSAWLRFTEEDYSKIPRIPQRFRVAPQLSRLIRQEIRYKTGRPCYRELKVRDLQIFDRKKDKDIDEGTFKEMYIFHWLVDIDEEGFGDVVTDPFQENERPKTSGSLRTKGKLTNTPLSVEDIFDVGIPL